MKKRVVTLLLAAGLLVVAGLTALTFSASAQTQTVYVQLPSGETVPVQVDVPPGSTLDDIQLPGTPVPAPTTPERLADFCTDATGKSHGTSIPPPLLRPDVIA